MSGATAVRGMASFHPSATQRGVRLAIPPATSTACSWATWSEREGHLHHLRGTDMPTKLRLTLNTLRANVLLTQWPVTSLDLLDDYDHFVEQAYKEKAA